MKKLEKPPLWLLIGIAVSIFTSFFSCSPIPFQELVILDEQLTNNDKGNQIHKAHTIWDDQCCTIEVYAPDEAMEGDTVIATFIR
jgi:hypothetical protein